MTTSPNSTPAPSALLLEPNRLPRLLTKEVIILISDRSSFSARCGLVACSRAPCRAGSGPAPSRGVNWPRNGCSILLYQRDVCAPWHKVCQNTKGAPNFREFLFHALGCIEVCSVYYLALCDSPEPFIKAKFTSRTPETWRRPSTRESSSSSWLPLPRTSSASSSPAEEPGRTTMRSRGTSEASISLLSSARDVSLRRTSLTRLASLRFGNKRCL